MTRYIDGFAFPIPTDRLDAYRTLAGAVAEIWKEHGALDYREFVGDDLHREGLRSFTDSVAATDEESIVFGWVEFASRTARDLANERVAADPRMADLVDAADVGFDAGRMVYGGFRPLVGVSRPDGAR